MITAAIWLLWSVIAYRIGIETVGNSRLRFGNHSFDREGLETLAMISAVTVAAICLTIGVNR